MCSQEKCPAIPRLSRRGGTLLRIFMILRYILIDDNIFKVNISNFIMVTNYKDLKIYHLSYSLTLEIYKLVNNLPESESSNISSQLKRAAVSMPLNIAEGASRRSMKEFLNFLAYSFGSAKEIEVLLKLCKDFNYIDDNDYYKIHSDLDEFMGVLFRFMNGVETRITRTNKEKYFKKFNKSSF